MKSLFRTTALMIGQMIRACGADDDAPPGLMSRKLRFLVIVDNDEPSLLKLPSCRGDGIQNFKTPERSRVFSRSAETS